VDVKRDLRPGPATRPSKTSVLAEGETLSSGGITYSYTVRGELAVGYYANGVSLPAGAIVSWDDRMGVPLSENGNTNNILWGYDTAGRMTMENAGASQGRSYDVENLLIAGGLNYSWGPRDQIVSMGSSAQETLHWSGTQLLFTTTPKGVVDDVKIGTEADVLPVDPGHGDVTLYDRGPDSSVGGCYNAAASTFYSENNSYIGKKSIGFGITQAVDVSPCGPTSMPTTLQWWADGLADPAPLPGVGGTLGMPRTDGLVTGTDILQGVRTFDPFGGVWTTPDFNPPDVNDPMTLKSYVWNGNNPVSNQDPSGFVDLAPCTAGQPHYDAAGNQLCMYTVADTNATNLFCAVGCIGGGGSSGPIGGLPSSDAFTWDWCAGGKTKTTSFGPPNAGMWALAAGMTPVLPAWGVPPPPAPTETTMPLPSGPQLITDVGIGIAVFTQPEVSGPALAASVGTRGALVMALGEGVKDASNCH
jgi:hypothetical protein